MTATLLLGLAGLVLLLAGGELLVRGASSLAAKLGLSRLAIGLTVVAFGTSAPELAVSLGSTLADRPGLAVGNVVGSNIFNVLFILGVSALVAPLVVRREVVRREAPLVLVVSLALLVLAGDGVVARWEGALLAGGLGLFLWSSFRRGASGGGTEEEGEEEEPTSVGSSKDAADAGDTHGGIASVLLVAAGLALLVVGSRWLVDGAVAAARSLGVGEVIVGLTLVAAGTSMPEIVTSLMAAARGERDIAVGNVLGSNVFNVLGILGITALAAPGGLPVEPAVLRFDVPVMIAAAAACLPLFFTGHRIDRWEGALLLGYYAAYVLYLFLAATSHDALGAFSATMLLYVIPLTVVTLAVVAVRELRRARSG